MIGSFRGSSDLGICKWGVKFYLLNLTQACPGVF